MAQYTETGFQRSAKGKIIIASLLACFALLLAWGVSRLTFKQILSAVDHISAPNDKLRLVDELSLGVTQLDQLQKARILSNPASYYSFYKETNRLIQVIDTLELLYAGDSVQVKRIASLKTLLIDRDKLFINYLKVREGLVNNKSFTSQVKLLNKLVNKTARQNSKADTGTVKKTTITILPVETSDTIPASQGFFSRLFGKKQPVQTQKKVTYKVVDEEQHIKRANTQVKTLRDSLIKGMGTTMRSMEKAQLEKSALFVSKETSLNRANNRLVSRILGILKQVQTEAEAQVALNNHAARQVVDTGIARIGVIMVVFFVITVVLLYFILTDITRSIRYRKELELARDEAEYHGQAKQRFLSNMSHEIRTPLQSIMGYAELMREQEHPQSRDIEAVYQSSAHLMQIVNEVLDYSRIISGKFTFTNQIFHLPALLDEVITVLRLQAEKKKLNLFSRLDISGNTWLEGDPFRLKQILYNLLGNAIKFTETGEVKLSVSCRKANGRPYYTFAVTDTGTGLSGKDIKRIFNEFEQAQDSGQHPLNGAGLGLTISKALVESQGGQMEVKSEPGKGSAFTFTIPYRAAEKPADAIESPAVQMTQPYSKVWIVDDDRFILELCSALFNAHQVPHRCFASPVELMSTPFDAEVKCIFMDIRMPGMNGTELCRVMRNKIPDDVKIYALTAQVMPGEREVVLNQGFDGLLMKPFKINDLLAVITPAVKPVENLPEIKLDLSKLEKMTFGDKHQLNRILQRFVEDCRHDIAELKQSASDHDRETTVLLTHRIAGRTAQIGAAELAAELRAAEINFHKHGKVNADAGLEGLISRIQELMAYIQSVYLSEALIQEAGN